jgi:hypothetical protein
VIMASPAASGGYSKPSRFVGQVSGKRESDDERQIRCENLSPD